MKGSQVSHWSWQSLISVFSHPLLPHIVHSLACLQNLRALLLAACRHFLVVIVLNQPIAHQGRLAVKASLVIGSFGSRKTLVQSEFAGRMGGATQSSKALHIAITGIYKSPLILFTSLCSYASKVKAVIVMWPHDVKPLSLELAIDA